MEFSYEKEIAELIFKAWTDPAFKGKLLENPREAFLECGIPFFEGKIHVYESNKDEWHFVLPMKPEEEISDQELRDISGGTCLSKNDGGCNFSG